MKTTVKYGCGCVNEYLEPHELQISLSKCPSHVAARECMPTGREYYELLGATVDGIPQCRKLIREMTSALSLDFAPHRSALALEVGCGCSYYVPLLAELGYKYHGIDIDPYATEWTRSTFDVATSTCALDDLKGEGPFDLILAAHSLEHFADARTALKIMRQFIVDDGELILVVPDDTDPVNPDHFTFFTEKSLSGELADAGFVIEQIKTKRVVEHENFIYCLARAKP